MSSPRQTGRLIAVVGPSGVGKDSVMDGLRAACQNLRIVRRTITREAGLGGEDYEAVSDTDFTQMAQDNAFCVHWPAHGLQYGIPADVLTDTENGISCIGNFSRSALSEADQVFDDLVVLNLTADPETLAARLAGRGRESAEDIAKRLAQAGKPLPVGLNVVTIANDGALDKTIHRAIQALGLTAKVPSEA